MTRVVTRAASIVLFALLFLPTAAAAAGDREGPSSKEVKDGPSKKEVKEMIEFGVSLGKQGLWKEALYRWKEALRHDPDNPQLHNNIAVALESQGDLEGARESYRRAVELAGRAKYIERNIEDFEELFTALEQYEEQYRKPPADPPENGDAAGAGDAETGEAPADQPAVEEDDAADDEPGRESEPPAGDQPAEEVE